MACVAVLVQALGIVFQRRSQWSASQGLKRSWVGAVIKEIVEWSLHSTSIPGWSRRRLCRVLYPETSERRGCGGFTRHSPGRGIVPQAMDGYPFTQSGAPGGFAAGHLQRRGAHMLALSPGGEQVIVAGADGAEVPAQNFQQAW